MVAILTFDPALFRQQFPAFADVALYPDAQLQRYWDMAVCYSTDVDYCKAELGVISCRQTALNMLTAHLLTIGTGAVTGQTVGMVQSATVDKVSVTIQAPENPNQWQWWLNKTPYGQMYLALLRAKSAGGFYIGGSPERSAFRSVGGGFPRGF